MKWVFTYNTHDSKTHEMGFNTQKTHTRHDTTYRVGWRKLVGLEALGRHIEIFNIIREHNSIYNMLTRTLELVLRAAVCRLSQKLHFSDENHKLTYQTPMSSSYVICI